MPPLSARHAIDRQYHDGIAAQYDNVVVRPRIFTIGLLFEGFASAFGPCGTMLDLGCGTGHLLLRYAQQFRSVLGVDHSSGMLQAAAANLQAAGISHSILLRRELQAFMADCASHFDLISCVGVLHHLTEDERGSLLQAMRQRCHGSSRVLLAEPVLAEEAPAAVLQWNQAALGGRRAYSGDIPAEPDEAPIAEDRWRQQIEDAGFAIMVESRMWEMSTTTEYPGPSEREQIRRIIADHPGGNVLALLLGPI